VKIVASGRFGPGNGLPSTFSYENFGTVRQKGIELGVDTPLTPEVSVYGNYAYQPTPDPKGFDISELNLPSKHHFNVGLGYNGPRILGNVSVSYASDAFWQDVLDSRFHGPTDAFTMINATVGYKWRGDKLVTSLKITNLGNQEIQQHVFGDITRRQVVGELRVAF